MTEDMMSKYPPGLHAVVTRQQRFAYSVSLHDRGVSFFYVGVANTRWGAKRMARKAMAKRIRLHMGPEPGDEFEVWPARNDR